MNEYDSYDENRPVMWLRGYPLYAAHVIVLIFVVSMLATTALMAFNGQALLNGLVFTSGEVLSGEVWRILTYGLVNPPSLWFVIDMFMIVWFGRELEKSFGRRTFLGLFGGLYLVSPLLLTLVGFWRPTQLTGQTGGFGLFIAFATLYPNVALFFNVLAKWVAAILVGMYTLIALSNHDMVGLIALWATSGFAFAFVRFQQGRFTLPTFRVWRRTPQLRVLPDLETAERGKSARGDSMVEIDALLDKIAQSGIASLTAKERAKLDAAREDLLKRDAGRP